MACFVICTIALFLAPVPRVLLDILLVSNIILSLIILLRGVFLSEPTQLFAFPMLLVLSTLFRLALNVSSTRLILLHGETGLDAAGHVIEAFGTFVVQGDFVVGAIVFGLIAVVNFIVITKGSARVAEVSARFALDALPGRQISIDADLRSGTITREEAQARRAQLNRESHFYGSMDGAMRFVQGDAIACLIIVFVAAVGGMALGVSRGLPFSDAVSTFGILAIGDGLVSIIPSLLISVCTGIVVTNASRRSQTSGQMVAALFADDQSLLIAGLAAAFFGVILATYVSFFAVAVVLLLLWAGRRRRREESGGSVSVTVSPYSGLDDAGERLQPAPLLGTGLDLVVLEVSPTSGDPKVQEAYLDRRDRLFRLRGIPLPKMSLSVNPRLGVGEYRILLRERVVRSGRVFADRICAVVSPSQLQAFAITDVSPVGYPIDGRSASWLRPTPEALTALDRMGIEILTAADFLAAEVAGALLVHIDEIFGLDEVKTLVSVLHEQYPHIVDEVLGNQIISYPELADVLRRLARERVSIRDVKLVLEGIAEFSCRETAGEDRQGWLAALYPFLRRVLSRTIIGDSIGPGERLRAFVLSKDAEEEFREAVSSWDGYRAPPPLAPDVAESLRANATRMFGPVLERGALPIVVLCSADIRTALDEFLVEQTLGGEWLRTVAFEELGGRYRTETVGVLGT